MKINIKSLNLEEDIQNVYVYKDYEERQFLPYYNDEKKLPINLEKIYWNIFGKTNNYFDEVEDIKIEILKNVKMRSTGDLKIVYIRVSQ